MLPPRPSLPARPQVISVEVPNTVELEVVETDPGVKGNTAGVGGPDRAGPGWAGPDRLPRTACVPVLLL